MLVIVTGTYAREAGKAKPLSVRLSGRGHRIALLTSLALLVPGAILLGVVTLLAGLGALVLAHLLRQDVVA